MSAYDNVRGGGLKLKGGIGKKKKKTSKNHPNGESERTSAMRRDSDSGRAEEGILGHVEAAFSVPDRRTTAEQRFEAIQQEREKKKLENAAKVTYRDQIEQFNKKLADEPEHFDLPKVSHTK